jgi:hypothetical protein
MTILAVVQHVHAKIAIVQIANVLFKQAQKKETVFRFLFICIVVFD